VSYDTDSIAKWLIDGARSTARPQDLVAELCERVVGCGIPLWRAAVFVRTLHPNVAGRRFEWRLGEAVSVVEMPYEMLDEAAIADSPIPRVCRTGLAIRCRPGVAPHASDFPALESFRSEGLTDYWVTPLFFSNVEVHVANWATRQAGGFTEEQLCGIERLLAPFARVAEAHRSQPARNLRWPS